MPPRVTPAEAAHRARMAELVAEHERRIGRLAVWATAFVAAVTTATALYVAAFPRDEPTRVWGQTTLMSVVAYGVGWLAGRRFG